MTSPRIDHLHRVLRAVLEHPWPPGTLDLVGQLFNPDTRIPAKPSDPVRYIEGDASSDAFSGLRPPRLAFKSDTPDRNVELVWAQQFTARPLRVRTPDVLIASSTDAGCQALAKALNPPTVVHWDARVPETSAADALSDAFDGIHELKRLADALNIPAHDASFVEFGVQLLCLAAAHHSIVAATLNTASDDHSLDQALEQIEQRLGKSAKSLNNRLACDHFGDGPPPRVELIAQPDPRAFTITLKGPGGQVSIGGHRIWADALCAAAGLGSVDRAIRALSETVASPNAFVGALCGESVLVAAPDRPTTQPRTDSSRKAAGAATKTRNQPKPSAVATARPIAPDVLAVLQAGNLTDGRFLLPPGQMARPMYERVRDELLTIGYAWKTNAQAFVPKNERSRQRLEAAVAGGQILDAKDYDFFPTPADVASELIRISAIAPGMRVLEPSCGELALAQRAAQIVGKHNVVCLDINPEFVDLARKEGFEAHLVDFLHADLSSLGRFDLALMNPPFARGVDVQHVLQAARCADRVASIMGLHYQHGQTGDSPAFREAVADPAVCLAQIDVPAGAFAQSGTQVPTIMMSLDSAALLDRIVGNEVVDRMERPRLAA